MAKGQSETKSYEDRREYLIQAVSKRRRVIKQKAIEYKGGKCELCGYQKYRGALDLHHLNPAGKSFAISQRGHSRAWNRVKIELDKCVLVCANCHREIEAGLHPSLIDNSLAPGTGLEPAT